MGMHAWMDDWLVGWLAGLVGFEPTTYWLRASRSRHC